MKSFIFLVTNIEPVNKAVAAITESPSFSLYSRRKKPAFLAINESTEVIENNLMVFSMAIASLSEIDELKSSVIVIEEI